jgi:hypothetical protein
MQRIIVVALAGAVLTLSVPTIASAHQCVARSTNGVSAWATRAALGSAQRAALHQCAVVGGNHSGAHCFIDYCR